MQLFTNYSSGAFKLNGKTFVKNFIVLPIGDTHIAVHNAYDTRNQILPATHFSEIRIGGVAFPSQELLLQELAPMLFVKQLVDLEAVEKDEILSVSFDLFGNDFYIYEGAVWRLNGNLYSNIEEFVATITSASSGFTRIDIVVANTDGEFELINGVEDEENAAAPAVPNNTLLMTTITVIGDAFVIDNPFAGAGDYLKKIESNEVTFNGVDTVSSWPLPSYVGALRFVGDVSHFHSIDFDQIEGDETYSGKRFVLKNFQSLPITIGHLTGAGAFRFHFPDGEDFVLQPNESIEFVITTIYNRLEYLGRISSGGGVGNLQSTLDNGSYASGHSITLKQAFNSDSRIDINVDNFFEPYIRVNNGGVGSGGHWITIGSDSIELNGNGDFLQTILRSYNGTATNYWPHESGIIATRNWVTGNTASSSEIAAISAVTTGHTTTLNNYGVILDDQDTILSDHEDRISTNLSKILAVSAATIAHTSQIASLSAITTGHTSQIATMSGTVATLGMIPSFTQFEQHINYPQFQSSTITNVMGHPFVASNGPTPRTFDSTNLFTQMQAVGLVTTTTVGYLPQLRQTANSYLIRQRGYVATFKFGAYENANTGDTRIFVGLCTSGIASNVSPATYTNTLGICKLASGTTWSLVHNDGSGTATVVDTGFAANTIATDIYQLTISATSSGASFIVDNTVTGARFTYSTTTDLPSTTTALKQLIWICNNTSALAVGMNFYGSTITQFNGQ